MPDTLTTALRTQHLLTVLAHWLAATAACPEPERIASAHILAECALTAARDVVIQIDGEVRS